MTRNAGCSDIIQSIEAKPAENANTVRPIPLIHDRPAGIGAASSRGAHST